MPDPVIIQTGAPVVPVAATVPAAPVTATPNNPQAPARPVQGTPAPVQQPAATPVAAPATPPAGMIPIAAMHEERTKRQELERELAQLRQTQQPQGQPQMPQQPQQVPMPAGQPTQEQIDYLWQNDPRRAVQVQMEMYSDYRDRVDGSVNYNADQIAARNPDFNNYRSMVLGYVRTLPLNQRANPGIIEAAYHMIRGQNVDQLIAAREAEILAKYQRGEYTAQMLQQPTGGYSAPIVTPGQVQLSADQIKVAEMMGLDPQAYASQIKLTTPPSGGA